LLLEMVFLKRKLLLLPLELLFWRLFGALLLWSFSAVSAAAGAEPSGLAAAVSIKQTTASTATAAFNVIIPLASAGNSRVALSESTSAMLGLFYVISVFY
jgi:hypothetical protein